MVQIPGTYFDLPVKDGDVIQTRMITDDGYPIILVNVRESFNGEYRAKYYVCRGKNNVDQ